MLPLLLFNSNYLNFLNCIYAHTYERTNSIKMNNMPAYLTSKSAGQTFKQFSVI